MIRPTHVIVRHQKMRQKKENSVQLLLSRGNMTRHICELLRLTSDYKYFLPTRDMLTKEIIHSAESHAVIQSRATLQRWLCKPVKQQPLHSLRFRTTFFRRNATVLYRPECIWHVMYTLYTPAAFTSKNLRKDTARIISKKPSSTSIFSKKKFRQHHHWCLCTVSAPGFTRTTSIAS